MQAYITVYLCVFQEEKEIIDTCLIVPLTFKEPQGKSSLFDSITVWWIWMMLLWNAEGFVFRTPFHDSSWSFWGISGPWFTGAEFFVLCVSDPRGLCQEHLCSVSSEHYIKFKCMNGHWILYLLKVLHCGSSSWTHPSKRLF